MRNRAGIGAGGVVAAAVVLLGVAGCRGEAKPSCDESAGTPSAQGASAPAGGSAASALCSGCDAVVMAAAAPLAACKLDITNGAPFRGVSEVECSRYLVLVEASRVAEPAARHASLLELVRSGGAPAVRWAAARGLSHSREIATLSREQAQELAKWAASETDDSLAYELGATLGKLPLGALGLEDAVRAQVVASKTDGYAAGVASGLPLTGLSPAWGETLAALLAKGRRGALLRPVARRLAERPEQHALVLSAALDPNRQELERADIVSALGPTNKVHNSCSSLRALLSASSPELASEAALQLAAATSVTCAAEWPKLLDSMEQLAKEPLSRTRYCEALGALRSQPTVPPALKARTVALLQQLVKDSRQDEFVRAAALDAMGRGDAATAFAETLLDDPQTMVSAQAALMTMRSR